MADLKSMIDKQVASRPEVRSTTRSNVPSAARGAKVTVELNAEHYRVLRLAALELAVPASRVVRALLAEYATDETLQARVQSRVRDTDDLSR